MKIIVFVLIFIWLFHGIYLFLFSAKNELMSLLEMENVENDEKEKENDEESGEKHEEIYPFPFLFSGKTVLMYL